jgi:hypothetical protein
MGREVDRLLAQLGGRRPPPTATRAPPASEVAPAASPATIVWASTPAPAPAIAPPAVVDGPTNETAALWGRVLLGTSLALMMVDWPYAHGCGWPLLGYGFAVATLLIVGGWIALSAWKQRDGRALILALILSYWGLVLAAEVVLPRVGYASVIEGWQCSERARPN